MVGYLSLPSEQHFWSNQANEKLIQEYEKLFLTVVKTFNNKFLQSYMKGTPDERVQTGNTSETSERLINYLEEKIVVLREELK